ncbi:MAG: translation initiation factor IF-2 [Chlamydiota bacterium]
MAKNLKLKIKNEQLAQALNLNKIKRPVASTQDTPSEVEKVPHVAEAPAKSSIQEQSLEKVKKSIKSPSTNKEEPESPQKKAIKATNVPSSFQEKKVEPAKTVAPAEPVEISPPPVTSVEVSPPAPVVVLPVVTTPSAPAIDKEFKHPSPKISEPAVTKEVIADLSNKKDFKHPKAEGREEPIKHVKTSDIKEDLPKIAKDPKLAVKRVETQKFDTRDRQGLRETEEDSWRRKRHAKSKYSHKVEIPIVRPKSISVKLPITVKDLAAAMKIKASDLITKLFLQGFVVTINDYLEDETSIQLLGVEFDCDIKIDTTEEKKLRITELTISEEIKQTSAADLVPRPPIVTFMGHVDHGKTSLIDALRKSHIAAGEAGAITQHIGAFRCHAESGDVTVLDTPGHEAFKEMRMRGAHVTDIVILVIAGDEGMMPQTQEAIKHAKQAGVAILVAINKCDKPTFNPDQVYRQLADQDLLPEAWGGSTITVNCSAITGQGIPQLLEMILLQAEILELKANPKVRARGTVIESQLHRGLGPVANVLIQNGTLRCGDALVFEDVYGRVKTIHNEYGKLIDSATPSMPVKITGLSGIPDAGCEFIVVENEKTAKAICESRLAGQERIRTFGRTPKKELDNLLQRTKELAEKKTLNLILRADVQGSLEALKNSLMNLPSEKVVLHFISESVGQIAESDIELAHNSHAAIIGFHTSIESHALEDIARYRITIKTHDIIYQLVNDVKQLMVNKLDKIRVETEVAQVSVKTIFKSSQLGNIAGCQVVDGTIKRNHFVKLERNRQVLWQGHISSLKRNKEDVKEVAKGLECGIVLDKYQDLLEGDIIRAFEISFHTQELS